MLREEIFVGLTPQERRPISNLFGDLQWTYVGQEENQKSSTELPLASVEDGVPVEFVKAYAMLAMNAGDKKGAKDIAPNVFIVLTIACFCPPWLLLLLMLWPAFSIFYSQRSYRRALALADQFYDRTIYRFEGGSRVRPVEVVKKIIKI